MKRLFIMACASIVSFVFSTQIYAAGWVQTAVGTKWQNNDTSFVTGEWRWIDADGDDLAECYYFGDDSLLMKNTTTPDGSSVDENGAWVINSIVQKKEGVVDENKWIDQHRSELEDFARRADNHEDDYLFTVCDKLLDSSFEGDFVTYQASNGKFVRIRNNPAQAYLQYVYYGEMEGEFYSGQGTLYRTYQSRDSKQYYCLYRGEWRDGMPNGYGEEYRRPVNDATCPLRITGNYLNWYQNGEMTSKYIYLGEHYTYHYNVVDGMPVPIGQEYDTTGSLCNVVAYPDEGGTGFLTFYDTVQTACLIKPYGERRKANSYGYHRRPGTPASKQ